MGDEREGPTCPGCGHDPHSPGYCVMFADPEGPGLATCQCQYGAAVGDEREGLLPSDWSSVEDLTASVVAYRARVGQLTQELQEATDLLRAIWTEHTHGHLAEAPEEVQRVLGVHGG